MTHSECTAPVNSSRPIAMAVATLTVAYIATYSDRIVTMTASASSTFGRATFPRNDGANQQPGDGQFYLAAPECGCCKCRAVFVFGDQTFASVPDTGEPFFRPLCGVLLVPVTITVTTQAVDADGNPTGDPTVVEIETVAILRLWERLAAPCKAGNGPSGRNPDGSDAGPAVAVLWFPGAPLNIDDDRIPDPSAGETITLTVTGSYGVTLDGSSLYPLAGFQPVVFATPDPCSDTQAFDATLVKAWDLSDITATSTMVFSLGMS